MNKNAYNSKPLQPISSCDKTPLNFRDSDTIINPPTIRKIAISIYKGSRPWCYQSLKSSSWELIMSWRQGHRFFNFIKLSGEASAAARLFLLDILSDNIRRKKRYSIQHSYKSNWGIYLAFSMTIPSNRAKSLEMFFLLLLSFCKKKKKKISSLIFWWNVLHHLVY